MKLAQKILNCVPSPGVSATHEFVSIFLAIKELNCNLSLLHNSVCIFPSVCPSVHAHGGHSTHCTATAFTLATPSPSLHCRPTRTPTALCPPNCTILAHCIKKVKWLPSARTALCRKSSTLQAFLLFAFISRQKIRQQNFNLRNKKVHYLFLWSIYTTLMKLEERYICPIRYALLCGFGHALPCGFRPITKWT